MESRLEEVLVALRRIMRSVYLHSQSLRQRCGLSGPQLVLLRELAQRGECSGTELARAVSLSLATTTGILGRLEGRGLVARRRSETDRRQILQCATPAAHELLSEAPPPLQDSFAERFRALEDWEQLQLMASLQRLVMLMEARDIDAGPFLETGRLDESQTEDD